MYVDDKFNGKGNTTIQQQLDGTPTRYLYIQNSAKTTQSLDDWMADGVTARAETFAAAQRLNDSMACDVMILVVVF